MFDYDSLAADAAGLIEEFGAPTSLERAIAGDYDVALGEVDDNGTQLYTTKAVRSQWKLSDIDGTNIRANDIRLLVSPSLATEPKIGDTIVFDSMRLTVVNSRPVKPALVVCLHDVQCRDA